MSQKYSVGQRVEVILGDKWVPGEVTRVDLDELLIRAEGHPAGSGVLKPRGLGLAGEFVGVRAAEVESIARLPDPVNHPPHYAESGIEPIDAIEAWNLDFCLGNTVKYIARAGKKDPTKTLEDLRKARWYLERKIGQLEGALK